MIKKFLIQLALVFLGTASADDSTLIYYNRIDSIQAIQSNDLGVNCYSSCDHVQMDRYL